MYKLIRRISSSVVPRPDRPWEEDATSNAPQIGRKRRLSSSDREDSPELVKRSRATPDGGSEAVSREGTPVAQAKDTTEVKEVTKGVKKVKLEDKGKLKGGADGQEKPKSGTEGEDKDGNVSSLEGKDAQLDSAKKETSISAGPSLPKTLTTKEVKPENVPLPEDEDASADTPVVEARRPRSIRPLPRTRAKASKKGSQKATGSTAAAVPSPPV